MKRLIVCVCACLFTFWTGRIYSVNRNYSAHEERYQSDSVIDVGDLEVAFQQARIYTCEEFEDKYNVKFDDACEVDDTRIISACFDVRNMSDTDLAWDDVMDSLQCGFESLTWASSVDPSVTSAINVFCSDVFKAGTTQEIGFATVMTRASFRDKSWERLGDDQYYYVFARRPEKVMMEIDLPR